MNEGTHEGAARPAKPAMRELGPKLVPVVVGLMLVGGVVLSGRHDAPSSNAVDLAQAQSDAAAAVERADAPAPAPQAPAPVASTLPADATAFFTRFEAAGGVCDDASNQAKALMDGGDPADAYQATKSAEAVCLQSINAIGHLEAPESASDDLGKEFDQSRAVCQDAYESKRGVLLRVLKILNGDNRPSTVADAREKTEQANAGIDACLAAMTAVVEKAGGTVPASVKG